MNSPIKPGDRVILREDGEVWTVDHVRTDGAKWRIALTSRMFGDGPLQVANVSDDEIIKIG